MTLEELYEQIEGDYQEALGRLRMDKLISKFIMKFLDDTTCNDLVEAWGRGDEAATFDAAHSAKGVCMNLSMNKLAGLASEITEALRPGNEELRSQVDIDSLVNELQALYVKTVDAIKAYAESAS